MWRKRFCPVMLQTIINRFAMSDEGIGSARFVTFYLETYAKLVIFIICEERQAGAMLTTVFWKLSFHESQRGGRGWHWVPTKVKWETNALYTTLQEQPLFTASILTALLLVTESYQITSILSVTQKHNARYDMTFLCVLCCLHLWEGGKFSGSLKTHHNTNINRCEFSLYLDMHET